MLERVIESYYKNRKFNNFVFLRAFRDFKYFVCNESFSILIIAPLMNFQSQDVDSIRIDKNLKIRKLTKKERSSLIEATGDLVLNTINVHQFNYIIEYEFEHIVAKHVMLEPNSSSKYPINQLVMYQCIMHYV
jgi:hypothetical protein